jgi:endonuclease/exonuclease/phosphatase family metal-dependent hydrolase
MQALIVSCAIVLLANGAFGELPVSVMTFNVRYGTADDGPNRWELRKDIVVDTIASREPHIVGLQECLKFQADYIASRMSQYDHFGVGREADGGGERMEVFYRPDVIIPLESGHFWLSETPDVPGSRSWNSANVRMATWARYRHIATGRQFLYLNTHLDHRSEQARVEAARMLAKWANDAPDRLPVIITADFNATAEQSSPWTILTQELRDAWLVASERVGPQLTWSSFNAPTDEIRRIDWILVSPDVNVTKCETVTYNVDGRFPSDHYPVFAVLK